MKKRALLLLLLVFTVMAPTTGGGPGGTPQTDCDNAVNSKVLYDITTGLWSCGVDQGGGGGGDNITVNASSATDANFIDGDIDWTLNTVPAPDTIAATVACTGCVDDTDLASNYSGVGACGANTWASTLNDNAAPTCTQPAFSNLSGTVGDAQIAASAVDGGAAGEIEDGTITADDLASAVDPHPTVTLGPFFVNDLPANATTQATQPFFNTATALSRSTNDIAIRAGAKVVGIFITSDAARTAGTATAQVRIAGAATAFNGGSVVLDATNTTSDSDMVAHASGNTIAAGNTIGCAIVTPVGWTPTTADINCLVVISYD